MNYSVESGESLMDVAIAHYGSVMGMLNLAQDNALSSLTDVLTPINLHVNDIKIEVYAEPTPPVVAEDLQYYLPIDNQNVMDAALQLYGDVLGMLYIMQDANVDATARLSVVTDIPLRNASFNKDYTAYINKNRYEIATDKLIVVTNTGRVFSTHWGLQFG